MWTLKCDANIVVKPFLNNETFFCVGNDSSVYAISKLSGKLEWKTKIDGSISFQPVLLDTEIYIGDGAGSIYDLNSQTGKIIWHRKISSTSISPSLFIHGSNIFGGSDDSTIYSLNSLNGKVVWKTKLKYSYTTLINFLHDSLIVLNGHHIYTVDPNKGVSKDKMGVGISKFVDDCIYKENYLYLNFHNTIVVVNPFNVRDNFIISSLDHPLDNHPLVTDSFIFFSKSRNGMYCYKHYGLNPKWEYKNKAFIFHFDIYGKELFMGCQDSTFRCINPSNGIEIAKYKFPDAVLTFANDKDVFFVSCGNRTIYAIKRD